jgi:peptidoglycan hydrolase-like protein with peptidoglycan-binding domain
MTVPSVTQGRGAWTATGKDNRSRYYEYIVGKPLDGSAAGKDVNYLAVNLGVKALQARINAYGYSPKLTEDGVLGARSKAGIAWIQGKLKLTADGQAGQITMKAIFRDLVAWYAGMSGVPAGHIWGMMMLESVADPGAVGFSTPSDLGLCQINIEAHPDVTAQQAHDPHFAIPYTTNRLAGARAKFGGKGSELQIKCSIAQHNAPAWAASWYSTGQPPNEKIAAYVTKVLSLAETYK